jgi:transposase
VPKPFPREFRRDVIAVARQGDQSIAQAARNFGVSESCLAWWLEIADREDGLSGGISSPGTAGGGGDLESENRELRRRTKQSAGMSRSLDRARHRGGSSLLVLVSAETPEETHEPAQRLSDALVPLVVGAPPQRPSAGGGRLRARVGCVLAGEPAAGLGVGRLTGCYC